MTKIENSNSKSFNEKFKDINFWLSKIYFDTESEDVIQKVIDNIVIRKKKLLLLL